MTDICFDLLHVHFHHRDIWLQRTSLLTLKAIFLEALLETFSLPVKRPLRLSTPESLQRVALLLSIRFALLNSPFRALGRSGQRIRLVRLGVGHHQTHDSSQVSGVVTRNLSWPLSQIHHRHVTPIQAEFQRSGPRTVGSILQEHQDTHTHGTWDKRCARHGTSVSHLFGDTWTTHQTEINWGSPNIETAVLHHIWTLYPGWGPA